METDWQVEFEHNEYALIGLDEGSSQLRILSSPSIWPDQVLLRLTMPRMRPVVRTRLLRDGPDGTVVEQELVPEVCAEDEKGWVFDYVLRPADSVGAPRYVIDWEVRRKEGWRESNGDEQLITRAWVVVVDADGAEHAVDGGPLRLFWWSLSNTGGFARMLLSEAARSGLPAPAALALREFAEAADAPVPLCDYCTLNWELDLLDAASRAWPVVAELGSDHAKDVLRRWSLSMEGREGSWPCNCPRGRPLSSRAVRTPEDVLRRDLEAARARHSAMAAALRG